MDLPATALEMINSFIKKKTYADIMLPSESYCMDQVNTNVAKHNHGKFINGLSEFVLIFFFIIASMFGYIYYRHQFEPIYLIGRKFFTIQRTISTDSYKITAG
jgi:hypothetical protein